MENIFTKIYENNTWAHSSTNGKIVPQQESKSGEGSTLAQTGKIRETLPQLFKQLGVNSITDASCGDFNWFKEIKMDGTIYLGIDIVESVIEENNKKYKDNFRNFVVGNIISYPLPSHDLILCRDCLVHLSVQDVFSAIKNFKKSKSTYLLTTTFIRPDRKNSLDMKTGNWQPINLMASPFNFPQPLVIINEHCTEFDGQYSDKSLALWKIEDIPLSQK